jgi:peroxiredoxin
MTSQINTFRFNQTLRNVDLMTVVTQAFLRQLPLWRSDFCSQTEVHNIVALSDMLHKMKGSCFAVAADDAAEQFGLAEASLKHISEEAWQSKSSMLLNVLDEIEAELLNILVQNRK